MRNAGRWTVDVVRASVGGYERAETVAAFGRHVSSSYAHATSGVAGVHATAGAGRSATILGSAFFHGDDDRVLAVALLDAAILALDAEIQAQLALASSDAHAWCLHEEAPALAAWRAFKAAQHISTMTRTATAWETYEDWHERIARLRSDARAVGFSITSPPPPDLPMTASERGEAGVGTKIDTLWTTLKSIAYGAVAVVGFWGLYTAYRDVRAKNFLRDPGPTSPERYVSYTVPRNTPPSYVGRFSPRHLQRRHT